MGNSIDREKQTSAANSIQSRKEDQTDISVIFR